MLAWQDGPETRPHVADAADEVMYGRKTNQHHARRNKITQLPLHGFGGGYRAAAGMGSAECIEAGEEQLDLKLQNKISKALYRHLSRACMRAAPTAPPRLSSVALTVCA